MWLRGQFSVDSGAKVFCCIVIFRLGKAATAPLVLFLALKTVGTVFFSLMFLCTMGFSGASLGIF